MIGPRSLRRERGSMGCAPWPNERLRATPGGGWRELPTASEGVWGGAPSEDPPPRSLCRERGSRGCAPWPNERLRATPGGGWRELPTASEGVWGGAPSEDPPEAGPE